MIEFKKFKAAMIYIGKRTASAPDAELLEMYHQYLSPLLTTDEFLEAAKGVFITDVFFPPPIAFLKARMRREWRAVVDLLDEFNPPYTKADWHDRLMELSEEARHTISLLGGPLAFKEQVLNRDVSKAYTMFSERYVESLADLASVEQIETPAEAPRLPKYRTRITTPDSDEPGLPLGHEGVEVVE